MNGYTTRRATVATIGYSLVMLEIDRRLQRTGGPGIVPFELAGTETRAREIQTAWGPRGQHLARTSLRLDFGYMLTYGANAALLVDAARRKRDDSPAVLGLVIGAVACDAAEGISLLNVIEGRRVAVNAVRARRFAVTKFALLLLSLGYVAAARAGSVAGATDCRSRRQQSGHGTSVGSPHGSSAVGEERADRG